MLSRLDNVNVDVLGSKRTIVFNMTSTHRYFISNVAKDECSQGFTTIGQQKDLVGNPKPGYLGGSLSLVVT